MAYLSSPAMYRGGKYKYLDYLLPLFPESRTYIEVFGGMGSIMWNKRPISYRNVYNDLDSRLVCIFEAIRDDADELIRRLYYTPDSREEFETAIRKLNSNECTDKIEKARCCMPHKNIIDPIAEFIIENKVLIENMPADKLIKKANAKSGNDVFMYIDPPYFASSESLGDLYGLEFTLDDHETVLKLANESSHKIAISNYHSELYDDYLRGWILDEFDVVSFGYAGVKGEKKMLRKECVWRNYEIDRLEQVALF